MRNLLLGLGFIGGAPASVAASAAAAADVMYPGYGSWWKHNEGAGVGIIDYGADTTNASFQGLAENLWAYNAPDGSAVAFYAGAIVDFSNDIGNTVHIAGSANTASMTFLMAFYPKDSNVTPADTIISKQDRGNSSNWKFHVQQNQFQLEMCFGNMRSTSNLVLAASTWYIMAATIHCDGIGVTTQFWVWDSATCAASGASGGYYTEPGDPNGEDDYILIGAYDGQGDESGGEEFWEGLIGDIVIWDTILASADIESSMKSIRNRYAL